MECIHCHRRIGLSYHDQENYNDLLKGEKRTRQPGFFLEVIRGPHCLLAFKYNKQQFYIFGEDHDAQKDYDGLTLFLKTLRSQGLVFGGVSLKEMYIERFLFAMTAIPNTKIYLEVVAPTLGKRERGLWEGVDRYDDIGKEHLAELYHLFDGMIETGGGDALTKRNVGIFPVDYRNNNAKKGTYHFMPDYVCHYSLYERLYQQKKYEWIRVLFQTEENDSWEWELLYMTLFETEQPTFREYSLRFRTRFDNLYKRNSSNLDLTFFYNIPGVRYPERSFNEQGISIQATLFNRLQQSHKYEILMACKNACKRTPPRRLESMELYISEIHAWYLDVPALCQMLTTPSEGNSFGYFGSTHVINMMKMISTIDRRFKFCVNGENAIEMPSDIQKEFNDLL